LRVKLSVCSLAQRMKMGLRNMRWLRTLNRRNCSEKPLKIESLGKREKKEKNREDKKKVGVFVVFEVLKD